MKTTVMALMAVAVLALVAAPAIADWNEGDPYKMHWPQMPNPVGWDVAFSTNLADDWGCTQSGPVTDIHFWISWKDDEEMTNQIGMISITIHADDRTGEYSKPGEFLWGQAFLPDQVTIRPYGTGDQGWFDPLEGVVIPNDHQLIYQVNITDIRNPFYQEEGKIYWLNLYIQDKDGWPLPVGWKTSKSDHFEDDAVFWAGNEYFELIDPRTQESLDLAFVITPEPATLMLITLGGTGLIFRRKKRK